MAGEKKFVINGKNFSDIKGFYNEIQTILTHNFTKFGKNLDAFDDLLYGGLGKFEHNEKIILIWENFEKSKRDIDAEYLKKILDVIKSHKNVTFKSKMESKNEILNKINKLTDVEEIKKYVYSNQWIIRQEAIKRLGEISDPKSIELLINILQANKDNYDIIYVNSSLGRLKAKSAVPELIKYIDSKKIDIAQSAIYALGEIGDKSTIPYLEKKVKNLKIGDYCKAALKKLNKNG